MQLKLHMVTIDDLVPEEHLLRKLESMLDLSFVYEATAHLYSHRYGRPPIDPVVMVKYLLVGFLYGIPSERQIERRIQTDVALRWYLGLDLFDRVPDHSTISQLRRRKPGFRKVLRRLFEEVVKQCVTKGLVSGRLMATDSTHVKANASRKSEYLEEVEHTAGAYWELLDQYEEEGLAELERKTGQRRQKRVKQVKRRCKQPHRRKSRTDPEAGYLNRPGKPHGMHYLSHETVDTDCGIIIGVSVTPGDSNDSAPYLKHLEEVLQRVSVQAATADAAYDFPLAHQELHRRDIDFFVRPQTYFNRSAAEFRRDDFPYDEQRDEFLCPNGKWLPLRTLHRGASGLHWEYSADRADCQTCPLREKCLPPEGSRQTRKLERNYFESVIRQNLARRDEPEYKEALKLRQIWSEGTFSAQKREHNLTKLQRRGIEAAEDHCLLSATALNLKRMIRWMK